MSRTKRGLSHLKRRRNILKRVKGHEAGRKNLLKLAKTAQLKAGAHAYRDRRVKKRTMRGLWNIRINAAVRPAGLNFSQFMGMLTKKTIKLDRKALSQIAAKYPQVFEEIIKTARA